MMRHVAVHRLSPTGQLETRYVTQRVSPGGAFETLDGAVYAVKATGAMVRLNRPAGTKRQRRDARRAARAAQP